MITFEAIKNKTVLVGITYINKEGEEIEKSQFYGRVVDAGIDNGISILVDGKSNIINLPPDLSGIEVAPKGRYHLYSTERIVENPDYIATWIVENDA